MKRLLTLTLFLGLVWGQVCPEDNLTLINTYQSKYVNGQLLELYKCSNNHSVWFPSVTQPLNSVTQPSNSGQQFDFGKTILNQANISDGYIQQELELLSRMTEEQRYRYIMAKQAQIEKQERMYKMCLYSMVAMFGIAYLIDESGCTSPLCEFFGF